MVISDKKEIEKLGESIVQGICAVKSFFSPSQVFALPEASVYPETRSKSAICFTEIFNEVFAEDKKRQKEGALCRKRDTEGKICLNDLIIHTEIEKNNRLILSNLSIHGKDIKKKRNRRNRRNRKNKSKFNRKGNGKGNENEERKNMNIKINEPKRWSRDELPSRAYTFDVDERENKYEGALPSEGIGPSDRMQRVSAETVASLLRENARFFLIDCRSDYEYSGGHLRSAQNIKTQEEIKEFFQKVMQRQGNTIDIFVFYCEYSSVRAPRLAGYLRNEDRRHSTYPCIFFPDVYIMSGGYKEFFGKYPELCIPQGYTPM